MFCRETLKKENNYRIQNNQFYQQFVTFRPYTTHFMISGAKMTVGQFLQKLPKSVIKDGKVIDIRNSVGENLMVRGRQRERQR